MTFLEDKAPAHTAKATQTSYPILSEKKKNSGLPIYGTVIQVTSRDPPPETIKRELITRLPSDMVW